MYVCHGSGLDVSLFHFPLYLIVRYLTHILYVKAINSSTTDDTDVGTLTDDT